MHTTAQHPRLRLVTALAALALPAALVAVGCQHKVAPKNQQTGIKYATLDSKKDFPAYMKGTIWELTNRANDTPFASASYGLVGRLRGTGDSTVSLPVREWMVKQMARHGYGSKLQPGYERAGAEKILRDPGFAIVRVDGMIPPGAREGDFFDVQVSALPGNRTSSLSGGILFEADLTLRRTNAPDLTGVEVLARAKGPIVVNPAYALQGVGPAAPPSGAAQARRSLRTGVIMGGGRVMHDRPLMLRLLQPQRSTARYIEQRINQRFQSVADHARTDVMPISHHVAAAQDEGVVEVYVPGAYGGDWEHFINVVEHLYLSAAPANLVERARELTEAALLPEARLLNISYALEGIGDPALQYVLPLLANPSPDVAFAMARAAVFIGDPSGAAQDALVRMARDDRHTFQVAAIQTLGALPRSPERNLRLRELLNSRNTMARIEAYKVLARSKDGGVYTKWIKDPRDGRPEGERAEKFGLDIVPSSGEPLVFASRSGIPRIALIGPVPTLKLPVLFTAMESRLMISSPAAGSNVTIFFRDDGDREPIQMPSRPDLAELIARLGGEGAPEEQRFDFTYGEIVAILQSLSEQRKVTAARPDGRVSATPFIFEQPGDSQDLIESAPVIEQTRPNTDGSASLDGATIDGGE